MSIAGSTDSVGWRLHVRPSRRLRQFVRPTSRGDRRRPWPMPSRGPDCRDAVADATRSLLLTSGKGGVGTSNLALNLAIALGELGQRVVLVDADLGLANIDLLCGSDAAIRPGRRAGGRCRWPTRSCRGLAESGSCPGRMRMRTGSSVLGDGAGAAGRRAGRAGGGGRLPAGRRRLGAGPGHRPCWPRRPTRWWSSRRPSRPRWPMPTRRSAGSAAWPARLGCGVSSTRRRRRAEAERRPRPARRRRAGSSSGRWCHPGTGARPGRPARPAGGPGPPAVRDGLSQLGRLARRPTAGPRPDRRAAAAEPRRAPASSAARCALALAVGG